MAEQNTPLPGDDPEEEQSPEARKRFLRWMAILGGLGLLGLIVIVVILFATGKLPSTRADSTATLPTPIPTAQVAAAEPTDVSTAVPSPTPTPTSTSTLVPAATKVPPTAEPTNTLAPTRTRTSTSTPAPKVTITVRDVVTTPLAAGTTISNPQTSPAVVTSTKFFTVGAASHQVITVPVDLKGADLAKWMNENVKIPSYKSGGPGFPKDCAGMCWNKEHKNYLVLYGPMDGSDDITESPKKFGDGTKSALDLMRDGDVTSVIFANKYDAQLEACAIGALDGVTMTQVLGVADGECARASLPIGWHVVEGNANSPVAGFGVRYTNVGWAGMTEKKVVEYTKYWKIISSTATWLGPNNVEILMVPSMVSMMQDFGSLTVVKFTTNISGTLLFCNGNVTGAAKLNSPDGACHLYEVGPGKFVYAGEKRTSAGISWQPEVKTP